MVGGRIIVRVSPVHTLLKRFAGRFALTLSLVVLEAAGWTLFPLAIGRAIDGVLTDSPRGLYQLAGLGIVAMGIGIVRRIVDSRAYARIYARLGKELLKQHPETGTSTTTARLGMLREIVEFFENSLPGLITSLVGLAGTILILSALNFPVFLACLAVTGATIALYALTGGLTTRYNEGLNDEHERQVDAVASGDAVRVGLHLRDMMRWNIRLSDLEAANFGDRVAVHDRLAGVHYRRGSGPDLRIRNGLRRRDVRLPVRRIGHVASLLLPAVAALAGDLGSALRHRPGDLREGEPTALAADL